MAKRWTFVALVLDRSGSMGAIQEEARTGFNEQLDTIKDNARRGGRTRIMMVTFNDEVTELFAGRTAGKVDHLSKEDYRPGGLTAMYDAVGHTINQLDRDNPMFQDVGEGDDVAFLVIVVSDGMENASKEWTSDKLAKKVKELQDKGNWTFSYIGANQDLADVEKHLGFNNVAGWQNTSVGTQAMSSTLTSGTTRYFASRGAGAQAVDDYFDGDDDEDSGSE